MKEKISRHFNAILMLNNIAEMRGSSMVGEGLPDHPADDGVVVHLLEGCVKAGRVSGQDNMLGCKRNEDGWMDEWRMDGWIEDSIAIVDVTNLFLVGNDAQHAVYVVVDHPRICRLAVPFYLSFIDPFVLRNR